ncbi:GNAT family N-acetyltransferase [Vibrio sp.]|uniref:GNAT family N-acetyltransferase n=1 Tax=Vibrio sp. TaxID=678 RepID=UPI003F6A695F
MEIVQAEISDLENFYQYLDVQLLDNAGDDSPLFQPIAKHDCRVSGSLKAKFRNGFDVSIGESGWRKLWVVKDSFGHVFGHIDLRHNGGDYGFHRVCLGMGVDHSVRKQGLGDKLIESVVQFCRDTQGIDWLDLNVLSDNLPAKNLYLKCGFSIIGEMSDCYRIDGQSISEMTMTLCTKNIQKSYLKPSN